MNNEVYLLLGGNLGNRLQLIEQAETLIEQRIGTILRKSSIYESEPWGFSAEQQFLNAVVIVETLFPPETVLKETQSIENELGRTRSATKTGYSSRTMDIDLLFYNHLIINTLQLTLPHPKLHERKFTLLPLQEVVPDFIHPIKNMTINELLNSCSDTTTVSIFKKR